MFGIRCYARIQKSFYRTTALTLHCGSRFITTSMAFLDFLKPLKWKGLKLSHGLNSRHVRNFMTFHIVSRSNVSYSRFNCHNVGCEVEGHHNSVDGPEWRTYTKSFSFVEDCHLSSTIYFHDKNGRRSICSDWASFIQRPAGSNAPLISTNLYSSLWFELCARVNPKRAKVSSSLKIRTPFMEAKA